ncbi:hypothetical protein QEZ54_34115 [Catellatospora sp. KI3]|uniref:hypothetical protein n=1 Tax=Catellatospora sp. KI3 TaxID=3041620 RepID=UPI0024832DEF|nr:hypothetical protein [Catellatospora sp. KI3]MDI1466024.1 hypothetical protein [Catellatospora sp. KI3]
MNDGFSRPNATAWAREQERLGRPAPDWFVRNLIGGLVLVACAMGGYKVAQSLVEPVTRWQFEQVDRDTVRPPRPPLPTAPFTGPR